MFVIIYQLIIIKTVNKSLLYNTVFFCVLLTLSIVIVSCNFISPPKLISIEDVEINDINNDTLQLNISLQLANMNAFKMKANDITFDIEVDHSYVGNGIIEDEVIIKGGDTSSVNVVIYIEKEYLTDSLQINDSILLTIIGSAKVPLYPRRFKFSDERMLDISDYISEFTDNVIKPEDIVVEDIKIKKVTITTTKMEAIINFNNSSNLSYTIKDLNIFLFNDSKLSTQVGHSTVKEDIIIAADSMSTINTIVNIDNMKMGMTLLTNTRHQNNVMYMQINTNIEYENVVLPLSIVKKFKYNLITRKIDLQ